MANGAQGNSDLNYADTLWKSADALRGQVDAAESKHAVLGLLFLSTELTRAGIHGEVLNG